MRKQLVSSQVTRRSETERPRPVYTLTDKGKKVTAQLTTAHADDMTNPDGARGVDAGRSRAGRGQLGSARAPGHANDRDCRRPVRTGGEL